LDPLCHGVAVPENHAPSSVLELVALADAKGPLLRLPIDSSAYMFEVEGKTEVSDNTVNRFSALQFPKSRCEDAQVSEALTSSHPTACEPAAPMRTTSSARDHKSWKVSV
jgi:hypothetical protein